MDDRTSIRGVRLVDERLIEGSQRGGVCRDQRTVECVREVEPVFIPPERALEGWHVRGLHLLQP